VYQPDGFNWRQCGWVRYTASTAACVFLSKPWKSW